MKFDFNIDDFFEDKTSKRYAILKQEGLSGSELIDAMIYMRLIDAYQLQQILLNKYNITFVGVRLNTTPKEFQDIANKYKVIISNTKSLTVYIPFSVEFNKAEFELDVPDYAITYKYISNLNYQMIIGGHKGNTISNKVIPIRPKLLFKRLVLDCIEKGGTDIHFESKYVNKVPQHNILYRIKRELVKSDFTLDWETTQLVIQNAIAKMSMTSSMDLDSEYGITTDISDLFLDGTCEVRVTGSRVAAGYYIVMAVQTTTTTTLKINELGFPDRDVDIIRSLSKKRVGLTLITGEMRSGKNTTVFSMLNEIVDNPIRIISYENPIENRMQFPQKDYKGDIEVLKSMLRLAKKQDLDIAMLNEIPNSDVAFAVRDLINSAIGVITTTHLDRVWHLPYKIREFFGEEYKTVISQLNAVINQKVFRRWEAPNMQKRILSKEQGDFEMFCWKHGVTQYFQPEDMSEVKYRIQPLAEIVVFTDEMKSAMVNFDEIWRAENMIKAKVDQEHLRLENKVAEYINLGYFSLDEMRRLY